MPYFPFPGFPGQKHRGGYLPRLVTFPPQDAKFSSSPTYCNSFGAVRLTVAWSLLADGMAVLGDYQIPQPRYNAHPSTPVSCGASSWGTCCGEDLASCNTASCPRHKDKIRLLEALPN